MRRDEALSRLRQHETGLKRLGVRALYLFGSTARDAARDDSDIDLFLDYERGMFGLFELMEVREQATTVLGQPADVTTRDSLHALLRPTIEADAIRVF